MKAEGSMESKESSSPYQTTQPFRLFDEKPSSGSGFLQFPEKPLPPLPPCLEVLPSELSRNVKFNVEPVNISGLTLLKGRVSTQEVFALANSDLEPGKYEGGLKLWEGSLDLIKALSSELQEGKLSLTGKRVLELGCGHGLPGIFSCIKGAQAVHFQDFNAEVLQCLTIPNVNSNLEKSVMDDKIKAETRFFAGDWSEVDSILPFVSSKENEVKNAGYDVIMMAETVYSVSILPALYKLIKQCVCNGSAVVYVAAKKYYFGVGGGSRRFLSVAEEDGAFAASLVAEVTDGSSNVREVWKLQLK